MATFVTIGRRLLAPEHLAFVEPYEASANPRVQTSRQFLSRVVLINRDSILIEEPAAAFAEANGFLRLPHDSVAINPLVFFQVEQFEAREGFVPERAYASRLLWRDRDGNQQSKLLMTEAETVFAVIAGEPVSQNAGAEPGPEQGSNPAPRRVPRRRPRQVKRDTLQPH